MFVFTYGNPEVKWQRNAVFKMPRLHRIQNFFTKITSAGSRVGLQSHLWDVTVVPGVWSYGWTPVLDCPTKPVFERTFADEAPGSAGWVGGEPAPPPAVQFTSGSEANKDIFFLIWAFQPFPLLYGSAGWLIDQPFWNWIWNPMRNIAKKRKMQDWVNEYPKNVKDNAKVRTWRAHPYTSM